MERLIHYSTRLKKKIIPHFCDKRQYEVNYKNKYLSDILDKNIEFLQKHTLMIGKEVYPYINSYSFDLSPSDDVLNPTETIQITFTQEKYDQLYTDYIAFQIENYTDYLIHIKMSTGSNALLNIEFGWSIDCIQELIKFYKTLLNKRI